MMNDSNEEIVATPRKTPTRASKAIATAKIKDVIHDDIHTSSSDDDKDSKKLCNKDEENNTENNDDEEDIAFVIKTPQKRKNVHIQIVMNMIMLILINTILILLINSSDYDEDDSDSDNNNNNNIHKSSSIKKLTVVSDDEEPDKDFANSKSKWDKRIIQRGFAVSDR
eukprot:UN07933